MSKFFKEYVFNEFINHIKDENLSIEEIAAQQVIDLVICLKFKDISNVCMQTNQNIINAINDNKKEFYELIKSRVDLKFKDPSIKNVQYQLNGLWTGDFKDFQEYLITKEANKILKPEKSKKQRVSI